MEGNRIGYIKYVFEIAWFNLVWFKWHLGADISIFDSCGWNTYKRIKNKNKISGGYLNDKDESA
ncbi:hypothetical protein B4073_1777 [Bacillus subtilis]|nr:hypothetical protein B4068_2075 [Bacillus subtilis]KIN51253.1 hypothetical protein B4073_1777 [Bacillus subtilis]